MVNASWNWMKINIPYPDINILILHPHFGQKGLSNSKMKQKIRIFSYEIQQSSGFPPQSAKTKSGWFICI